MSKSVEECHLLFRLEAIPVFYPIATFLALLEGGRRRQTFGPVNVRSKVGTLGTVFKTGEGRNSPSG